MLKIRLKRVGRKHDPSFRVVLIDSKKGPKSGKINEVLGFYDARKDIKELKADEIKDWISKGAQVSDTVHNILVGEKIIEGKKINVLPKKTPVVKEKDEGAEATRTEETPKEEVKEGTESIPEGADDSTKEEEVKGETPTEETSKVEEPTNEGAPSEESKEEIPAEDAKEE